MSMSRHAQTAGRRFRKNPPLIERLELRQLFSKVILFSGDWKGTYQLDAQSTAASSDPHYTGSGTITVTLTNGIGTATLSGLTGAAVTVVDGDSTATTTATVTSNSGQAVIADDGSGVTGTFAATGTIEFKDVITSPDGPPLTSDTTNPDPLAFPFTGTYVNGVISGTFEASVYQSGQFSLTKVGGAGPVTLPKTRAPAVFKQAVVEAEASPGLNYGGSNADDMAAILIAKHEGKVLFVYPDAHGNPTVGVGFNLNQSGAQQTIDNLFGTGTYAAWMASFARTQAQWLADYGNLDHFDDWSSAEWVAFRKKYDATSSKSQNLVSGTDGDILTNVLTPDDPTTGAQGTLSKLFESTLPSYTAGAQSIVGADAFNNLDPAAQAALVDIVYNLGATGTQNGFAAMITALQNGDYVGAAEAIFDGTNTKGQTWATLSASQKLRAIDDFRYIISGLESELPQLPKAR